MDTKRRLFRAWMAGVESEMRVVGYSGGWGDLPAEGRFRRIRKFLKWYELNIKVN